MQVPTPAAPLIVSADVIGGAFNFVPVIISALALFVVAALGWRYAGRVLSWVLHFGALSAISGTGAKGLGNKARVVGRNARSAWVRSKRAGITPGGSKRHGVKRHPGGGTGNMPF
jgi:hypothetical protein